ncbi:M23 family metallopeptidase [Cohnella abietis]|uniref:M23ase beta-sheet core domain-containing protein n=1 Tax=Cohnella abietis TaxID=2507935 RepID=A0A3T1D3C6_9BACL|nr:M23 family metallopeptidase [Cohnella abietis]BBI32538.1 hypothetical protein KCTCHS21_19370 [Cohnella abietis]
MQIRDNVRERRRERIEQLIGKHAMEEAKRSEIMSSEIISEEVSQTSLDDVETELPRYDSSPVQLFPDRPRQDLQHKLDTFSSDPDPELWWKEREKSMKAGQVPGWQGLKGIPSSSRRTDNPSLDTGFNFTKLLRGFSLRLVFSIVVFAAVWGWFKLDLPGSLQARSWMVGSISRDMDFQAIEAWYGDTFGGSPSFFPFSRNEVQTKEVSAVLNPNETAAPVHGRLMQSYAQNGTGVKIAAAGGSEVVAIYTGRVQQVTTEDQDGGVTILIQHENHILSVYGNLKHSVVKPNDWVKTGQQLGQLNTASKAGGKEVLYFAVQQNGKALDPADVVTFD